MRKTHFSEFHCTEYPIVNNKVRKGYRNIRVNFKVKADEENLEKLKALSRFSPVLDTVTKGMNVDIRIERK